MSSQANNWVDLLASFYSSYFQKSQIILLFLKASHQVSNQLQSENTIAGFSKEGSLMGGLNPTQHVRLSNVRFSIRTYLHNLLPCVCFSKDNWQ